MEKNGEPDVRSTSFGIRTLLHRFAPGIPFPDGPWCGPLERLHCRRPNAGPADVPEHEWYDGIEPEDAYRRAPRCSS